MYRITSDDAEICYEVTGSGPPVVLLHPFPANHELWHPIAQMLASRYRMIMPDLRGHGESSLGTGPATIQKHAFDIAHIMDAAGADRAALIGVSIGGVTRAYPVRYLAFHHMLNDQLGRVMLLPTY